MLIYNSGFKKGCLNEKGLHMVVKNMQNKSCILPTEAKQGWAWSVPGWETPGKTRLLLDEVLVRSAGGARPVVCMGPNTPV